MREWLEAIGRVFIGVFCVVAYAAMIWEGIEPPELFVAVLTASLGALGISAYGQVERARRSRRDRDHTQNRDV